MGMFRTPEEYSANPPETWQVVKAAPRVWRLLIADAVADTFTTRSEADDATQRGRWVELYRKEGRWFAGEPVEGWKPYRRPLHTLTQTHTSDDGHSRTMSSDSDSMTAAEAQRSRVKRLRAAGTPYTEGPGWVEYRDGGWSVRLEWVDAPGGIRADQVQPGAYVRAAGVDEYGTAQTLTGYASPSRMRYRKGLRRGAQCVALSMSETPSGAGGWRSVVFLECDAVVWPVTPPAEVARLAGEVPPAPVAEPVPVADPPGRPEPEAPRVPTVEACEDGEGVRRLTTAETAALVRAAVKAAFPGAKFSVRSENYSMGSSVHVTWTNGPTASAVEKITDAYRGSDFDGMQDLKTYRGPVQVTDGRGRVQRVRLGADFVITHRQVSETYAARFERLAADILGEPVDRSRWYDGDYPTRWGVWRACTGYNLLQWLAERVDPADLAEPEAAPEPVNPWADLLAARR